jgi:hypothetical protein
VNRVGLIVVLAALHVLTCALLPSGALPAWLLTSHVATKLLASAGTLAAFTTLQRHDYMRRFWGPLALVYFLLVVAEDPIAGALALGNAQGGLVLGALALIAANLLAVFASAVIAYTFRSAGLDTALGWRRIGVLLLAVVAAAGLVSTGLLHEVRGALAGGGLPSWASAISYLCDALTFVLLVPVLRYAYRLGRSKLAAPWWAFAASGICWLLFSAVERLQLPVDTLLVAEALRVAATLLTGLAGLLQRDLVFEARSQSDRPAPAA